MKDEPVEYDPARFQAVEEINFATAHAVETLIELLVQKGVISEKEFQDKMLEHDEVDDVEELGHDADAPRDRNE